MRQILVDYARGHRAAKRGGGEEVLSIDETGLVARGNSKELDILALDDGLKTLAKMDPRKAEIVQLRFFGGLSFNEIADVVKVSSVTVKRDWTTARAWLYREMSPGSHS